MFFCSSDMCLRPLTESEAASSVSNWTTNGSWDYSKLGSLVTNEVFRRLMAVPPPLPSAADDFMIWSGNVNRCFSVKSPYYFFEEPNHQLAHPCYKLIWKWQGAERIRAFMWLAFQNRLPTNDWRSRWSSASAMCPLCNSQVETLIHILRDCVYARNMWLSLIHPQFLQCFFNAQLSDWFQLNLKRVMGNSGRFSWDLVFGVGVWMLWNWRNKAGFMEDFNRPNSPASVILNSVSLYVITEPQGIVTMPSSISQPKWQAPMHGWTKLNVDGAASVSHNRASCGGVLRDSSGVWIAGFSAFLSCYEQTEEWVLLKGLELAWKMGLRKVIAESDSLNLVNMLLDSEGVSALSLVAYMSKAFMRRPLWEVKIVHISRLQNRVADKSARDFHLYSSFIEQYPVGVRDLVLQDCMGLNSPPISF
ncbi:hypothetical protein QN277_001024 [Acacia crassicarpa]|uniref:Uncharacterized protein n=1 Tax=Acacia crassicarpa TaxID=499986 RepID=A0AAE1N7S3_9FABA|nr:hypothetical protein QN277_001024 [Acacia crassicarpa]